jgi:hypothetical protein
MAIAKTASLKASTQSSDVLVSISRGSRSPATRHSGAPTPAPALVSLVVTSGGRHGGVRIRNHGPDGGARVTRAHPGARPWSADALREGGFAGFVPVAALHPGDVPAAPGVYAVLRVAEAAPMYLDASVGGRFKGKDPSVVGDVLARKWVDGAEVIYLGKATAGAVGKWGLRKRLEELERFGRGEPVRHWGGRFIWQLADHDDLLVAWNATDEDPSVVESRMLRDFIAHYDALPFANLRR